jgi:hypothetical protein
MPRWTWANASRPVTAVDTRFGEIQEVGNETLFVHAVGCGRFKRGGHDASVLRRPTNGSWSGGTVALHAPREGPEVRTEIGQPVHAANGNNRVFRSEIDRPGAGVGSPHGHERNEQG